MLYLKQFAPELYAEKIRDMRETYHTKKMTDCALTLDYWERVDRYTENLFFALKETL